MYMKKIPLQKKENQSALRPIYAGQIRWIGHILNRPANPSVGYVGYVVRWRACGGKEVFRVCSKKIFQDKTQVNLKKFLWWDPSQVKTTHCADVLLNQKYIHSTKESFVENFCWPTTQNFKLFEFFWKLETEIVQNTNWKHTFFPTDLNIASIDQWLRGTYSGTVEVGFRFEAEKDK